MSAWSQGDSTADSSSLSAFNFVVVELLVFRILVRFKQSLDSLHNHCEKFQNQLWQKFLINNGSKIIGHVL